MKGSGLEPLLRHVARTVSDVGPREAREVAWLLRQGVDLGGEQRVPAPGPAAKPNPPSTSAPSDPPPARVGMSGPADEPTADAPRPEPGVPLQARIPRPRAFENARLIDRALHRLGVRGPLGALQVDVGASVDIQARTGRPALVQRRAAVPVGTLVVIEDDALSMAPFRRAVAALLAHARQGRRFARVVHQRLDLSSVQVEGAGPWRDAPPGAPFLVVLFTDGLSPAFHTGGLARWLAGLPRTATLAWVHPWGPQRWARTGTSYLDRADLPPSGRGVPLLSLSGPGLERLERLVLGRGPGALRGVLLPCDAHDSDAHDSEVPPGAPRPLQPAQDLATAFHQVAHPLSRQALGLAAGVPGRVDLDLLRVLGARLSAGRIAPVHLAEALTSGLLRRGGDRAGTVVRFTGLGARKAALRWLPRGDLRTVLRCVLRYVSEHPGVGPGLCLPDVALLVSLVEGTPPADVDPEHAVLGELAEWLAATDFDVHPKLRELLAPPPPPHGTNAPPTLADRIHPLLPPPGWRTTDGDLAKVLDVEPSAIMALRVDGMHRVLPADGRGGSALSAEGIPVEDGRAHPAHRITLPSLQGRAQGAGTRRILQLPGGVDLPLRYVPGGTFQMGSPDGVGDGDEHPRHEVTLTAGFWLGETPVSQAQWAAVATGELAQREPHFQGPDRPMEQVSWHDAVAWLALLSKREGWQGVCLPTEAQWERACRAGTDTRWCFGDDEADLERFAWFDGNSEGETHPVAQKLPNAWGLHDMHGNVLEWCWDDWRRTYEGAVTDPRYEGAGDARGEDRMRRGGCYWGTADWCWSAYRGRSRAGGRSQFLGFRLLLPAPAPPLT